MIERVIRLTSILNYTPTSSLNAALSDEDFKTRFSKLLTDALHQEDKTKRFIALNTLQNEMPTEDLKKVALGLDYYGSMYNHTIRTTPPIPESAPGLENTHEHTEEFTPEIRRPKVVKKQVGYRIQMNKPDGKTAVSIYPSEKVRLDENTR